MSNDSVPSLVETLSTARKVVSLLRPYWRYILRNTLLTLALSVLGAATPLASKLLYDEAYPARDLPLALLLVVGVFAITASAGAVNAASSILSQDLSCRLSTSADILLFDHIQRLPLAFFERRPTGEIMSRFTDLRGSLSAMSSLIQTISISAIHLCLVPPLMASLNWRLTLLSMVVLPVTVFINLYSARLAQAHIKKNAEARADLGAMQFEIVAQLRSLKSLAMEEANLQSVTSQLKSIYKYQMKAATVQTTAAFLSGLVQALGALAFSAYAWRLLIAEQLTLGSFMAFSAYIGLLKGPVERLASTLTVLQQSGVALQRAYEYLDQPVEPPTSLAPSPPKLRATANRKPFAGFKFLDVTAGYADNPNIVKNLTFSCEPGQTTWIVGPSGSGKSTILKLVPRLLVPTSGQIMTADQDIRSIPLDLLRRKIAYVSQEAGIVRGTLRHNIVMGSPDVSSIDIEQIVADTGLQSLCDDLPHGLDSEIAEWGGSLSGGQRQRIAIARGLARNAPILLLDEATANLDKQSELAILERVRKRYRENTLVIVTHHLNAPMDQDQVLTVRSGNQSMP